MVHGLDATPDGERGHGGDGCGEFVSSDEEAVGWVDLVDEAETQSFGGGDHLPGKEELERGGGADEAREPLRSSVAGDEAELDLRLAEARGFAGEPQVTGECELAAAAEGEAVDEGDDGLAAGFDEAEDGLATKGFPLARGRVGLGELADIGSGGEGLCPGAGGEDDADVRVCGERGESDFELVEDGAVEGVEDLHAIKREQGDVVFYLADQGLVGHRVSMPLRGAAATPDDTIEGMIKGITLVSGIPSGDAFDQLSGLFAALGFEPGRGWTDAEGRGAAFLAPVGNLELVTGRAPAIPPLLVEVTQLDQVHASVRGWMLTRFRTEEIPEHLTEVEATHWNSRLFTVQLAPELRLGFWQSENPLHGRPVAMEGDLSAVGMRFAVVVARWNAVITDRLLQGTLDALRRSGAGKDAIEIVRVPGAWEIPSAARTLAETKRFDAIVTLGVLLRGETAHYEAIYTEVARGIGQSQQETGVPHAFGVLTCETLEQALDRAGLKAGNKGFEAAVAAIEMASIQRKIRESSPAEGEQS